ncbi:MAG: DUF3987 domain-containing protein [Deltaproteobacteria bacterium]|nr:DUF3987 domain-containing protein [Deltaproteobacteria bacterium]
MNNIEQLKEILQDKFKREYLPLLKKKNAHEMCGPNFLNGAPVGDDRLVVRLDNAGNVEHVFVRQDWMPGGDILDVFCKIESTDVAGLMKKYLPAGQQKKAKTGTRKHTADYVYRDESGQPVGIVRRWDYEGGGKDIRQFRIENGQEIPGKVPEVLYNLPDVLAAHTVIYVEGEKCADAVNGLKLPPEIVGTTAPGGSGGRWSENYNETFDRKHFVILSDNDEPGKKYCNRIVSEITAYVKSLKVVSLPGLGYSEDVADWIERGGTKEELLKIIENTPEYVPEDLEETEDTQFDKWNRARELFPKKPCPWWIFPYELPESLNQLARSCATSPTPLLGVAMSIMASVLGRTVIVSPKKSWKEPLILWICDIRASGEGKTPPVKMMMRTIYEVQAKAYREYKQACSEWDLLSPKDKKQTPPPPRERGYVTTDPTTEGIRSDISGHGGTLCYFDELSAFIGGQNQYKAGKGTDREAWLSLYDGSVVRLVRVSGSKFIEGSCISIIGGIQPETFAITFAGDNGRYLSDGTVYRFLFTFEIDQVRELTNESWEETNRVFWDIPLRNAMAWADNIISDPEWSPRVIRLNPEAQKRFFDWANDIRSTRFDLPKILRGFIPKIVGAALRMAGVLHCLHAFYEEEEPGTVLDLQGINRGIACAEFYMGHTVDAARGLVSDDTEATPEINEQNIHLARTLEALKPELDSGRLAVGYIHERYSRGCPEHVEISSPHAMGAFLRSLGLTIPDRAFTANGRRSVKCLQWDKKINSLLKQVRIVRDVCEVSTGEDSQAQTLEKQSLQCLQGTGCLADNSDIADMKSAPANLHQSSVSRQVRQFEQFSTDNLKNDTGQVAGPWNFNR